MEPYQIDLFVLRDIRVIGRQSGYFLFEPIQVSRRRNEDCENR